MKTETVTVAADNAAAEQAAKILDQGGLVAVPTETVYGIAARLERGTLSRLDRLKGRSAGKRYTLHIGGLDRLAEYVPHIPGRARKLINAAWPGPLTLVFVLSGPSLEMQKRKLHPDCFDLLYPDGTVGIRCPDHPACSRILNAAAWPIVAPSANPDSLPPAVSADQVKKYFDGKIDMIVDGGSEACKYKKSSTVVIVGTNNLKVLREGVYSEEEVIKMSTLRILFVCTGNTCRSPMAEGIARRILADIFGCTVDEAEQMGYKFSSAGTAAYVGVPASKEAEMVCRELEVSLKGHRSKLLTVQDIRDADLIFVMSREHARMCKELEPACESRVFPLDCEADITDPIGRGLEDYRASAWHIKKALEKRIGELL